MSLSQYLICNGQLYEPGKLFISPYNRSFRYGDGFFETMKMINGQIVLQNLHFERLFSSLQIMQFDKPDFLTAAYLSDQIQRLAKKNEHQALSRVRLTVFRGDGSLYDTENNLPNILIETSSLTELPSLHESGIHIDVYEDARKATDAFSSIKNNNYLPYAMATMWYKKNNLNDALLMNCYNRVSEATTSNLFIVKDNIIKTPALTEGCIAGVIRKYLLNCLAEAGIHFEETELTLHDVMQADELFLTNAGWYIKWVKQCSNKHYINNTSKRLFKQFISPLIKTF